MSSFFINEMLDEYEARGVFGETAKAIAGAYRKDHPLCRKCGEITVEKEGDLKMLEKLKEGTPITVLEGIYKGKSGVIEVIANAPRCYGAKISGGRMPPIVWFKPEEIEREEK